MKSLPVLLASTMLWLLQLACGAQTPCSWSAVGSGSAGFAGPMCVFDDGTGAALYSVGDFAPTPYFESAIGKWDGTSWSVVGAGFGSGAWINALSVFDDGSGPALYVAGAFSSVGSVAANNLARWDGSSWSSVGLGVSGGTVADLRVFDDGTVPVLVAGGDFTMAGGAPVGGIAAWDGTTWASFPGSPVGLTSVSVTRLQDLEDASGSGLYAAGSFIDPGVGAVTGIAKWDGTAWSWLPGTPTNNVLSMTVFDDGTGPALHASGYGSTSWCAKFDGLAWVLLGAGAGTSLTVYDDGSGPALYRASAPSPGSISRWNGSTWTTIGGVVLFQPGSMGPGAPRHLTVFDDGSGASLILGGIFSGVSVLQPANNIAAYGCGVGPSISATQAFPGAAVHINNGNLTPGHEYFNLFSFAPCPGGPGTGAGPLGTCLDSVALQSLSLQLQAPVGTEPFHFLAPSSYVTRPPLIGLPPLSVDAVCLDVTGGLIGQVSPVVRISVQ